MTTTKILSTVSALLVTGLLALQLQAAPSVQKAEASIMTTNATDWWDDRYGDGYLSNMSYSQDSLLSYKGWQYATYYNAERHVVVQRRELPDGQWQSLVLTDYTQTTNDNHNTISIGISPVDGRLHLAFDHHDDTLHYRQSSADVVNNPQDCHWDASLFGSVQDHLNHGTVSSLTYPRFAMAPDGTLIFEARLGQSGNGESWLWRYNNDGTWTETGKFIENTYDGGDANAYFFGIRFDINNRLHAAWVWRENFGGNSNHDIMYAYSDDHGSTWRNNSGSLVATTGSAFITLDDDVKVWDIPTDSGLINQEAMAVDLQGRVHILARRDIGGVNKQVHFWRDGNGTWIQSSTGINTRRWDNRSKIGFDSSGNVYAIMPSLQIASASAAKGYTDWTVVESRDSGRFHHSEPLIDYYAMRSGKDELYVYAQKGTVNSTSPDIAVIKYTLDGPAYSGWTLCAHEGQLCEFSATQEVRYGASGSYFAGSYTGSVACGNDSFGDPIPRVEKICEVYVNSGETVENWSFCAAEGETCRFPGTRNVRYGANDSYATGNYTHHVACDNATFGDPIRGTVKSCEININDWIYCAAEDQQCNFLGTREVRYGASGRYTTQILTDGTKCDNATFSDPIGDTVKACHYRKIED